MRTEGIKSSESVISCPVYKSVPEAMEKLEFSRCHVFALTDIKPATVNSKGQSLKDEKGEINPNTVFNILSRLESSAGGAKVPCKIGLSPNLIPQSDPLFSPNKMNTIFNDRLFICEDLAKFPTVLLLLTNTSLSPEFKNLPGLLLQREHTTQEQ